MYILSIIVPVYKVEKYLAQCVDSILAQTLKDYEIILVDDGSPDNCGKICDDYAEKHSNIRVIHKVNGGLTAARQTGMQAAQGKYVAFVDSDDWIDPEMFRILVDQAEEHSADISCGSFVFEYEDHCEPYQTIVSSGVYKGAQMDELRADAIYSVEKMAQGIAPSVCTKVFLRETAMEPFMSRTDKVSFGEDALFTYPTMFKANCVVVNNDLCAYHYRQWGSSMTHKYSDKYFYDLHTLYDSFTRAAQPIMTQKLETAIAYDYVYLYGIGVHMIMGRGNKVSYWKKHQLIKERMLDERFKKCLPLVQLERYPAFTAKQLGLLRKGKPGLFVLQYLAHVISSRVMRLIKR